MPEGIMIKHIPNGLNDPFQHFSYELVPRKPKEDEFIIVRAEITPYAQAEQAFVRWKLNGHDQTLVAGRRVTDYLKNNEYVEFELGRFKAQDWIQYRIEVESQGKNYASPWHMLVVGKTFTLGEVKTVAFRENVAVVEFLEVGQSQPALYFSFAGGTLKIINSLTPLELPCAEKTSWQALNDDHYVYQNDLTGYRVEICKQPFRYLVKDATGSVVLESYGGALPYWEWADDFAGQKEYTLRFKSTARNYYGFGERYDRLNQKGTVRKTCVYNPYLNQTEETYIPVPFFLTEKGYGLFLNTAQYTSFDLGGQLDDLLEIQGKTNRKQDYLEINLFFGEPKQILKEFLEITGTPALPPKWSFGPWISSNSWNTQREVIEQVEKLKALEIPATVLVVEAWSDEATFYLINDAQYDLKPGVEAFSYAELRFSPDSKWPDFKGMIDYIHANNLKFILWQIPVLKYMGNEENAQHERDIEYAISQGYCVKNKDGTPYRITDGWFGQSLLLDFTNPEARAWWFNKRKYLLEDLKVDGFKTDGGEFIFDDQLQFSDGSAGDEMRNLYPVKYIEAYHEFAGKDRITFSRAGFTGGQKYPLYWGGDQTSSFRTLKSLLIAGLSLNISGNPFWGWDLAGFSGDIPTPELYIRSVEMATFCPVMQFHSESRGAENWDRSPWNMQARTGDERIIDLFRFYANLRMNLLPYIYNEAIYISAHGEPLMRPLVYDYPDDPRVYNIEDQYLFGRNLLIAPVVVEGARQRKIYLPRGKWTDFWTGTVYPGESYINYRCDLGKIPVLLKDQSVLPLNLGADFQLGGPIGNRVDRYENLCFLLTGEKTERYRFIDDLGNEIFIAAEGGTVELKASGNLTCVYLLARQQLAAPADLIGKLPGRDDLLLYKWKL